jgi:hypothetical protein
MHFEVTAGPLYVGPISAHIREFKLRLYAKPTGSRMREFKLVCPAVCRPTPNEIFVKLDMLIVVMQA